MKRIILCSSGIAAVSAGFINGFDSRAIGFAGLGVILELMHSHEQSTSYIQIDAS